MKEDPILFVALDSNNKKEVYTMAEELYDVEGDFGFKINLNFLSQDHKYYLRRLKELGRPIFADMKIANGKRTMTWVIENLTEEEIDFTNIWASMEEQMKKTIGAVKEKGIKIFGVTVLTHFDDNYCQRIYRRSLGDTIKLFAEISHESDCDGIILPGTMLGVVEHLLIAKMTPGLRPPWYKEDKRHREKVSHIEAIENGATSGVMGGPITKSENPRETLRRVLIEMEEAKVSRN